MIRQNIFILLGSISSISLLSIATLLIPISTHSNYHNNCVKTTGIFLSDIPGFKELNSNDLNAMSVSLCNGSTPQKQENI